MIELDFYGDETRWFVGVVNNPDDPLQLGRVQIRINGVHSPNTNEVPDYALPWASCCVPTTEGGVSGIGKIPQLLPGATVFGIFLDGKASQLPVVLGSLPRVEIPTDIQLKTAQSNKSKTVAYTNFENGFVSPPRIPTNTSIEIRRSQAIKFFIENGLTIQQASGLVANLEYESNLQPTLVEGEGSTSKIGIARWGSFLGRSDKLKEFAADSLSQPRDWRDWDVQLMFVLYEFRNLFAASYVKLIESTDYKGGKQPRNSTYVVGKYYLRIPYSNLISSLEEREARAQTAYDQHVER
jgi:hypothetical protein